MSPVETIRQSNRNIAYVLQIVFVYILFFATLFALVYFGPTSFADYQAYLSYNKDAISNTYFLEVIPKYILSWEPQFSASFNSVDVLILFSFAWAFVFFIAAVANGAEMLAAFSIFASIFFPFILTTGLRVGPSYSAILFIIFFINKGALSLRSAFMISIVLASLFHDSIFFVSIVLFFAVLMQFFSMHGVFIRRFILIVSASLVFTSQTPIVGILLPIAENYFGARSIYVGGEIRSENLAVAYFLVLLFCSWINNSSASVSERSKNICCIMATACCLIFPIAPVASVRMSHFLIIAIIASQSYFFPLERRSDVKILMLPVYILLYVAQLTQVIV